MRPSVVRRRDPCHLNARIPKPATSITRVARAGVYSCSCDWMRNRRAAFSAAECKRTERRCRALRLAGRACRVHRVACRRTTPMISFSAPHAPQEPMTFEAPLPHAESRHPAQPSTFIFGDFRLDQANATLSREGSAVSLTPKAFSVLEYLVEQAGRLVTKDEFMDRIWSGVFVGDAALKVCVREIRRALGDDSQHPRYIETAHRRGYRFIAPVSMVTSVRSAPRVAEAFESAWRRRAPSDAADAIRAERRRQHRLPGDRRRPDRPGVRDGMGLASRLLLDGAIVREVSASPGVVFASDSVRQARHRPLGSRRRTADARAAHGRRARGARRGGIPSGGAARGIGRRAAVQRCTRRPTRNGRLHS